MSSLRESLALPAGTVVGDYCLERVQTTWGFYLVYLAAHVASRQEVAVVELLPEELVTRSEGGAIAGRSKQTEEILAWATERFAREGHGLAACPHPALPKVLAVFEANGTAYWVLPREENRNLKNWLQGLGRPPTEAELKRLLLPLLAGLERAHNAGLFHSNLKPETIQIDAQGRPSLIRFSGARQAIARHGHEAGAVTTGYSPPEQYDVEKREGPWTDIYSLAAVLHRAISGQAPPEADQRLVHDTFQPLASRYSASYRQEFLAAIDAALAVDPSDRPQSIAGWRVMLGVGAAGPNRSLPVLLGAAVAAILMIAVGVWFFFPKPTPPPTPPGPDDGGKDLVAQNDDQKSAEIEKTENKTEKIEKNPETDQTEKAVEKAAQLAQEAAEAAVQAEAAKVAAQEAVRRTPADDPAKKTAAEQAAAAAAAEAALKKAEAEQAAKLAAEAQRKQEMAEQQKIAAEAAKRAQEQGMPPDKAAAEQAAAQAAAEKMAAEKAAAQKKAAELAAAEKAAKEKVQADGKAPLRVTPEDAEKMGAVKMTPEQIAALQKAEAMAAAEKAAQEKALAEKALAEKMAAERAAAEEARSMVAAQAAAQKKAADLAAAEQAAAEQARAAAEKMAAEKAAAEKAEAEKMAANQQRDPNAGKYKKTGVEGVKEDDDGQKTGQTSSGGSAVSGIPGIWETTAADPDGKPKRRLTIYDDGRYSISDNHQWKDAGAILANAGRIQMLSDSGGGVIRSSFKFRTLSKIVTTGALGDEEWKRVSRSPGNDPDKPKK